MHTFAIGMTESGKTFLCKLLARRWKAAGQKIAVLDPNLERWSADFQTDDVVDFAIYCATQFDLRCFVDECDSDEFAEQKRRLIWLAKRGRHRGHFSTFIATRYTDIPKSVRSNCTTLYLFKSEPDDVDEMAKAFGCPELREMAAGLKKGEFVLVHRFQKPIRGRINFARGTVELEKR